MIKWQYTGDKWSLAKIGCMPVESVTKSLIDRQLSRIYKCLQRCNQQQNTTIKKKIGHIKVIKQALTKKNSTRVYTGISRMKVFHFISRLFKKIYHFSLQYFQSPYLE